MTANLDCVVARAAELSGRGRVVAIIVDMRESAAQSQEVTAIVAERLEHLCPSGAHAAIIVPDGLAKMQMRRAGQTAHADCHDFFMSEEEAEAWALADRPD